MGNSISISLHNGKRISRQHNNRTMTLHQKHIDPKRTSLNKTYIDLSLDEAYEKLFGAALEEYNSKQKRKDRKIPNYLKHIQNHQDAKGQAQPSYEMIVQFGSEKASVPPEEASQMLEEYIRGFIKRNPNLFVYGCYLHMDETTPHLHIDYIPFSDGYKKGLTRQAGLNRALDAQGIPHEEKTTQQITWQSTEREILKEIALAHSYTVASPTKEKRKHVEQEVFRDAQQKGEEYIRDLEEKGKRYVRIIKKKAQEEKEAILQAQSLEKEALEKEIQTLSMQKASLEEKIDSLNHQLVYTSGLDPKDRFIKKQEQQLKEKDKQISELTEKLTKAESILQTVPQLWEQYDASLHEKIFEEQEEQEDSPRVHFVWD
ncbi:MAG: plasmid recombination protein [Lachnospiraceae bacterium]|nr:plasmid recombination protein [Lachnospiraceae bacterium]